MNWCLIHIEIRKRNCSDLAPLKTQDAKPLPKRFKFLIKQVAEETKIRYQVPNSIPIGSRSND